MAKMAKKFCTKQGRTVSLPFSSLAYRSLPGPYRSPFSMPSKAAWLQRISVVVAALSLFCQYL